MTHPFSREIEIEPAHTALLFVDVQNYNCTWEGGEYAQLSAAEKEAALRLLLPHPAGDARCPTWCGCSRPAVARASR